MTGPTPPTAPEPTPGGWAAPPPAGPQPTGEGWVAPQLAARPSSPFRSAATRARWVVWLLGANVLAMIVSVGISLWGKFTIAGYEAGDLAVSDLDRFDGLFQSSGLLSIAVYIPTAIAWLAWSSRTVDNEDALGIGPSKYTPRMAIAWWFLPFANLIVPYRVHRDIYARYHAALAAGAGIVVLWWLVWLADSIFANVVGRIWLAADTFPALQTGLTLFVVSDLLTAVSAIIAIILVRRIQRRADILAATRDAPEPAATTIAESHPDVVEPQA